MASFPLVLTDLCHFEERPYKTAIEYYYYRRKDKRTGLISQSSVTYAQLKEQTRAVSAGLFNLIGNAKTVIGILMGPCIEYPAIVLGVLLTKNAFMPLDIEDSHDVLVQSVLSLGIQFIFAHPCDNAYLREIFNSFAVETHPLHKPDLGNEHFNLSLYKLSKGEEIPALMECADDTAYVVHTSGTTGSPKFIAVPHRCITPNILHLREIFHIDETSKVATMAPTTFDPSIVEIFMALSVNATLVIPSSVLKRNASDLAKILFTKAKVTVLQATPSLVRRFHIKDLHDIILNHQSSLRTMVFGGEKCPTCKTIKGWIRTSEHAQLPFAQKFFNLYGITEVSSWASCYEIPENNIMLGLDEEVPLGSPLYLTFLQVRNGDNVICTSNCVISSQAELTNIKINESALFTFPNSQNKDLASNAFEITGKLYIGSSERVCCINGKQTENFVNSGDLVNVRLCDTQFQLYFIERSDSIVKINGKKVDLNRITTVLEDLPEVQHCHVLVVNTYQIIAFVVRKDASICSTVDTSLITTMDAKKWNLKLLNVLSDTLAPTHLPINIIQISTIPITHHGKINESLLKMLFKEYRAKKSNRAYTLEDLLGAFDFILPSCTQNSSHKFLCNREWKEYSFYEMGADSVQAMIFINWIDSFLELPLLEVFPNALEILFSCNLMDFAKYIYQKISQCDTQNLRNSCKKHELENQKEPYSVAKFPRLNQELSPGDIWSISRGNSGQSFDGNIKNIPNVICDDSAVKTKLAIEWKYDTGKCIDASPMLLLKQSLGICFIGSHSHGFYALSLRDGTRVWEIMLPDRIESSACLSPCNNYVIVGCYDGYVYVFNVNDGKKHWKLETGSQVKSSPCPGKTGSSNVYIGSHDGCLYCLDVKEKKCAWKHDLKMGSIFSSPCISSNSSERDSVVYVGTLGGRLIAVSCNGSKVLWQKNINKPLFSSPCVCSVGVCIGSVDHSLYMFNHLTGNKIWSFHASGPIFSSPCLASNGQSILIGSHDHYLYNVSVKDGSMLWKTRFSSPVYSTPFPFVSRKNQISMVISVSTIGEICVVDQPTGSILSSQRLDGEIFSSPVVFKKEENCFKIIVGCRDDNLYCINLSLKCRIPL